MISLVVPSSAKQGTYVNVSVRVTNTIGYHASFTTEVFAGADLIFSKNEVIYDGESETYNTGFTMPGGDITILAWVDRWQVDHWGYYDHDSKIVTVEVPVEFAGAISRKELEYDETHAPVPVAGIPQGNRGLMHLWGRNDMNTNQKMGIYWLVLDPQGYIAEEYGPHWEMFWTGPGNAQGFVGSRFNLDKVGTYTIQVQLLMNPDNPQIVDRYSGDLCNVAPAVPEPTFASFGITEYTT